MFTTDTYFEINAFLLQAGVPIHLIYAFLYSIPLYQTLPITILSPP